MGKFSGEKSSVQSSSDQEGLPGGGSLGVILRGRRDVVRTKRWSRKVWSGAFPQVIGLKSPQASVKNVTSEAVPQGVN